MEEHFNFDCCGNPLISTLEETEMIHSVRSSSMLATEYYVAVCLGVGVNLKSSP
jgi:hypothetical protein